MSFGSDTPPVAGAPTTLFVIMNSADGTLSEYISVATIVSGAPVSLNVAPTPNGGFIAAWLTDSNPDPAVTNLEIQAQAYNAIGNPIGSSFMLNSITTGEQNIPSLAALSNGDIIAAWYDASGATGDASSGGINMRRIDFDPTNQNPTTSNFTLRLADDPSVPFELDPYVFDEFFGPDGYDADGDPLAISAVANVSNGAVTLNPNGTLQVSGVVGAPAPLSFDYTISDGNGGTATARATIIFPDDYAAVRPGSSVLIDYLANDFYVPQPGATPFTLPQGIADGSTQQGRASFVQGAQILYDPLLPSRGTVYELAGVQYNSFFFELAVGNSAPVFFNYFNNQTNANVTVTVQGWSQLGGTGADNFVGTADADHLSGGTGAANILAGGAGNDWYTVALAGDTITENAGAGTDSVRTNLLTYYLPGNVENLYYVRNFFVSSPSTLVIGPGGSFTGVGNSENNVIFSENQSGNDQLYGLDGDDRLVALGSGVYLSGGNGADTLQAAMLSPSNILLGGNGGDIYIVTGHQIIVEYAGQGTDTIRTWGNIYLYAGSEIERLEAVNPSLSTPIYLQGNELAQTLVGNNAINYLEGRQGSDTYT
ncbi:MAG TPA: cadherin-like domain-containing protein, partial [Sphingorhabdus sp.]|nr:cadherin-like domain-containing protein [Sphingorhabdus sp.]